jgi:hypothetical protein
MISMKLAHSLIPAFVALVLCGSPVFAQSTVNQCFYITQLQSWRAPDTKTIYIRVNNKRFFRLSLVDECSTLRTPSAHLITKTRGPETVCSAVDWDLQVSTSPPGAIPEPCIVDSMTLLTPDEVAAIPPQFKP